MRPRARVALLLGFLVLLALGGTAAHPEIRGRYHLRRVTPKELLLSEHEATKLSGHARDFAESLAAKDLLPEVLVLARDEAAKDDVFCFRALAFEVATGSAPRGPSTATKPLDENTLSVLAGCLHSRDRAVRDWALLRLPPDLRLFSLVMSNKEHASALPWLGDVAMANPALREECRGWELAWQWRDGGVWTGYIVVSRLEEWADANRSQLPEQLR
ncbi:MAG: hypothetical protein ACAI25_13590 [Planctomycetota bacterium]